MAVIVANIRETRDGVYIGRANVRYGLAASPLGNPYRLLTPDMPRNIPLDAYADWLDEQLQADTPAKREFDRLVALARAGDVALLCWCAPKACHGDVLKARIEQVMRRCETCDGKGGCTHCGGSGFISDGEGDYSCAACGGTGVCAECNGDGLSRECEP